MRIFYSFLIMVCSTILILLPVSIGIYDFRTDAREENDYVTTAAGVTTATVQLDKTLYDSDNSTISILSDLITDDPTFTSYNATSRAMGVSGLSANTTRTLTTTYDISAFTEGGLSSFLDYLPWIWILMWVAFPIAGLAAIWLGRA